MSDTIKIHVWIDTGYATASHKDYFEIDRQEWEEMSVEERDVYLDDLAVEFRDNKIEFGAYVEEE